MKKTKKKIALTFGINRYSKETYGDCDLFECENDADKFAQAMAEMGYDTSSYLSEAATCEDFSLQVSTAASAMKSGDEIVIYFSGHGTYLDGKDGEPARYNGICLYDAVLWDSELFRLFKRFKKGVRITWVSDCCFSGSNERSPRPEGIRVKSTKALNHVQYVPPGEEPVHGFLARLIALHSSQSNEYSLELGGIGGYYTFLLLEAMRERTSFGAIEKHIAKKLDRSQGQNPYMQHLNCPNYKNCKF